MPAAPLTLCVAQEAGAGGAVRLRRKAACSQVASRKWELPAPCVWLDPTQKFADAGAHGPKKQASSPCLLLLFGCPAAGGLPRQPLEPLVLSLLHRRTWPLPSSLVNLHGLCIEGSAPLGIQIYGIAGTGQNADFTNDAACWMEGQGSLFLVDRDRIGRATAGAQAAKHALVVVKGDMSPGMLKSLADLNRIHPRCRSPHQVPQNGR